MTNTTTTNHKLENAKKLRSQLNSFYDAYKKDNSNLDALTYAIYMEDLIIREGYYIDYEVPVKGSNKGTIMRAYEIKPKGRVLQEYKILKQLGYKVSHENLFKMINKYNYDKIVYNVQRNKVGIIKGYYHGNDKNNLRYRLNYVAIEEGKSVIRPTDWYEDSCVVFSTFEELALFIEESVNSLIIEDIDYAIAVPRRHLEFMDFKFWTEADLNGN